MKSKITLHIYAKTTKANATGQLPIYIRLTVDGQRFEFSSKKFIEKSKWSPELCKMKGSSEDGTKLFLFAIKALNFCREGAKAQSYFIFLHRNMSS